MSLSLARAHTRTFTVRWAAFNPFLHPSSPDVTVTLMGGVYRAPDDEFVYRLPVTTMQDQSTAKMAGGVVSFRFAVGNKVCDVCVCACVCVCVFCEFYIGG
jgi:hypothetical protein